MPCLNKISFMSLSSLSESRQWFDFNEPKNNCNYDPTLDPVPEFGVKYTLPLIKLNLGNEYADKTL